MAYDPAYSVFEEPYPGGAANPAPTTSSAASGEYQWLSPIASYLHGQSSSIPGYEGVTSPLNDPNYARDWRSDWAWANGKDTLGRKLNPADYQNEEDFRAAWEGKLLDEQPEALGKVERLSDGTLWIDEHGGTRDGTWYSPYLYDNGEFMGRFTLDPTKNIRLVDGDGKVLFSGSGAEAGPQLVDALTFGINKTGKSKWEVQAQDPQGNWTTEVKGDPGPGLIGNFLTGLGMSLPMALGVAFPALGVLGGLGTAGSAAAGSAIGSLAGGAMRGLPIGDILKNTALSAGTAYIGGSLFGGGSPTVALGQQGSAIADAASKIGDFADDAITVLGSTGRLVGSSLGSVAGGALNQLTNPGSTAQSSSSGGSSGGAINQPGVYDPGQNLITVAGAPGQTTGNILAGGPGLTGLAGLAQLPNPLAPGNETPPQNSDTTDYNENGEIVVPGTVAPTVPVGPIAAIGGAGALAAAAAGAGGTPAGAAPAATEPTAPAGAAPGDIVVTGAPTSGGNIVAGIGAGAGAAGVANAVAGANGGTAGGTGGNGGGLGLSDYLTLGSLAIGGLGNLLGGGGGGGGGTIPAGFGSGAGGDIFNKPLPTLPSTSPFASQNLGPRDVSKTYDEWITGGYGAPTSYFNHVPLQSTPSVSQPYVKPAPSVTMPDVRIPALSSVAAPSAPGADLLAAMLGQQPTAMARGGRTHGPSSHSTDSFAVRGPGTGREDKIPAVLSDGEYVMDAETVALLGDGSTDAGAKRLDQFRVNIRKHKGRKLAKGKFSANAKRPDAYLAGGLT